MKIAPKKAKRPCIIYILPEVKIKLDIYVNLAEGEISGLGKVRILRKGELLIEDIYLFDQKCTASNSELNQAKVADFLTDMIYSGEDPSVIRFWWHSHASGTTFWSEEDNETIFGFSNEWMVSLVTNFAGQYLCRVDSFQPVQTTAHDVPFCVYYETDENLIALLTKEVKEKVKFIVPKPAKVLVQPWNTIFHPAQTFVVAEGGLTNGPIASDWDDIPADIADGEY